MDSNPSLNQETNKTQHQQSSTSNNNNNNRINKQNMTGSVDNQTQTAPKPKFNKNRKPNNNNNNNNNKTLGNTSSHSDYQVDPQTNEIFVYSPKEPLLPQSPIKQPLQNNTTTPTIIDKDSLSWQQKDLLANNSVKLNPNSLPFIPKPPLNKDKDKDKKPPRRERNFKSKENQQTNNNIDSTTATTTTTTTTTTTSTNSNNVKNKKNFRNEKKNDNENNLNNSNSNKPQQRGGRNDNSNNNNKPRNNQKPNNNNNNNNNKINIIYKDEDFNNLEFTPLAIQIINKIQNNNYECMICYETIAKKSQVINCSSCFTMFHMNCIQQWASKSNSTTTTSSSMSGPNIIKQQPLKKWKCPGCRFVHEQSNIYKATCFCGKVTDPQYNPYYLPHSCGEVCGKPKGALGSSCPHKCTMQCHPGACLQCSSLGETKHCYCSKTTYRILCGEVDKGKPCESSCDKILNCKKHQCANQCHSGECNSCSVLETQKCYCGKVITEKLCGTGEMDQYSQDDPRYFSCKDKCNRKLNCGNHTCQKTCHKGPCDPCLLTPDRIKKCACSQTSLTELGINRQSCLDEIPVCQKKCNKLLACGEHTCQEKCHTGECGLCKIKVRANCRCGKLHENRQCGLVHQNKLINGAAFMCNNICRSLRSCKKHECGIKCCPSALHPEDTSGAHVCTLVCGRPLKCGIHKCQQLCHQNKCFGCYVNSYEELACPCGKTTLLPPVPCGTKPPMCIHPCTKARECGHEGSQILVHPCHHGPCPPCTVLIDRMCSGGHELRKNIKCCTTEVSCGGICGKILSCKKHTCPKICHSGPCQDSAHITSSGGCNYPCGIQLPNCSHGCMHPCHPDEECPPNQVCKQKMKLYCPCQRRSVESTCTGTDSVRQLECDEICEKEERDKKLREAFGIDSNGTSGSQAGSKTTTTTTTSPISPTNHSEDSTHNDSDEIHYETIQLLCKCSPKSIKKLENILDDYIHSNNLKLTLKYVDNIQHFFIIHICKLYQFKLRDRPMQNLIEVFRKSNSQAPSPKLSDSIQTSTVTSPLVGGSQSYAAISLNSPVFETQLVANPTIVFQNLNEFIKNEHINNVLSEFEGKYKLIWIDPFTCLCVFNDQFHFNQASQLKSIPFDNSVYQDDSSLFDTAQPIFKPIKPMDTNINSPLPNDFYSASQQMNKFSFLEDELTKPKGAPIKKQVTTTTTTTTTNNNNNNVKPTKIHDSFDSEVESMKKELDITKIENWENLE